VPLHRQLQVNLLEHLQVGHSEVERADKHKTD
jgi:hypothetical protein